MKFIRVNKKRFFMWEAKKLWLESGMPRKKALFKSKFIMSTITLKLWASKWVKPLNPLDLAETQDGKYWAAKGTLGNWYIFER